MSELTSVEKMMHAHIPEELMHTMEAPSLVPDVDNTASAVTQTGHGTLLLLTVYLETPRMVAKQSCKPTHLGP